MGITVPVDLPWMPVNLHRSFVTQTQRTELWLGFRLELGLEIYAYLLVSGPKMQGAMHDGQGCALSFILLLYFNC